MVSRRFPPGGDCPELCETSAAYQIVAHVATGEGFAGEGFARGVK